MNTFKHRGAMGDIIYALPTIHALGGGILYITKVHQYEVLKRLLDLQENIEVRSGKIKEVTYNMDQYRDIDDGTKHLALCHAEIFNVECNLIDRWIEVLPKHKADIIVSRTTRYHDIEEIDWKILKGYDVLFVGFQKDYKEFVNKTADTLHSWTKMELSNIFCGVHPNKKGNELFAKEIKNSVDSFINNN